MKQKIEIAPGKYWINDVTYQEAVLYCFQLVIDGKTGWQLPTYRIWLIEDDLIGWYQGRDTDFEYECDFRMACRPMRVV